MTLLLVVSMAFAVLTLVTYLGMTTGRASVRTYDVVNVLAAPPIIAYGYAVHAWPSVLLSSSYFVVAGIGLYQKRKG